MRPPLRTTDFGETWQESNAIEEFMRTKGHVTFNFAKGLKFRNENEGIVIATTLDDEDSLYFLQTTDGGKTWDEIEHVPRWYFSTFGLNWEDLTRENSWQVESNDLRFSVFKSLGTFQILKL